MASIRAGQILHLGGNNTIIDRLQSAGIGDINVASDIIREVGNPDNVDKVLQDPDFTFSMESTDVSLEVEGLLSGRLDGDASIASGTIIAFSDMKCTHITSPWKDDSLGSAGIVNAGVLVPSYYTTKASYKFGVSDNAGETFDLAGNSYYLAPFDPVVDAYVGNGVASAFVSSSAAVRHADGGYSSTEYKYVLGVIVNGDVQVEGADYSVSTAGLTLAETATVTFINGAPAASANVTVAYFANRNPSYPDNTTTHPDPTVKPAAVRGRDIEIRVHVPAGGSEASGTVSLRGIQSVTLEGTNTNEIEREMGTVLPIGRTITQRDVTGQVGVHPNNATNLFKLLRRITGVASAEVIGVVNDNFPVGIEIRIKNPRNRTQILKTLWVPDAKIQVPGVTPKAGAVVDFNLNYSSQKGNFYVIKGDATSLTLPS